ncbi:hypothetical protein MAPG_10475 [Magnaporthiopsis poae ATCC 64411]|uniref:Uncharacterized protein n=1 Tax=Magnaporthiopsis poae (strain ATCC 64411 / 73-15) TaxID=644358 RepID=A0A0C4ECP3_MAGP6|nr:hypothetical protein MAPG_10475 [Magnaporthiopsis poae ATCC 64411]
MSERILKGRETPKRPSERSHLDALAPTSKRARGGPSPWLSPAPSDASWYSATTPATLSSPDVVMTDVSADTTASTSMTITAQDPIICYGTIGRLPPRRTKGFNAGEEWECMGMTIQSSLKTSTLPKCRGVEEYVCLSIKEEPGLTPHHALYTDDGTKVAILDVQTDRRLRAIEPFEGLRLQAVLRAIDVKKSSKARFPVSINIMGPKSVATCVGNTLTELESYLQHPYFLTRGMEYFNPHFYRTESDSEYMTHLVGIDEETEVAKMLSQEIEGVMDSLTAGDLAGDETYDDIITDLAEHQRQGVKFIRRREDPEYCQAASNRIRLTRDASSRPGLGPISTTGGILADLMGMGKTLTAITAIATTRLHAKGFVSSAAQSGRGRPHGPTLVVVPSVQLMSVWKSEISKHVKPSRLLVCEFHGPKRAESPRVLIQTGSDVVITTYSTLVEDSKKCQKDRVLQNIIWYRVVLDEAHWIHNQSAKRFKAAKALASQRRWCLTGTPVQNSLNDLASLVGFLDIQPFAQPAKFRDHILRPLGEGSKDRCHNLRALLAAICLRRGSGCLDLPNEVKELVDVDQSPEEDAERIRAVAECRRKMEDTMGLAGGRSEAPKKYNIMFAAMMRLRLLCNNGTFRRAATADDAGDQPRTEDPDSGLCEQCADSEMAQSAEEFCPQCGKQTKQQASSKTPTRMLQSHPGLVTQSPAAASSPTVRDWYGRSSKLEKLVEKIQGYQPEDKSIVFSAWTSTLDILEHLLRNSGILFHRIDGSVDASHRAAIIEDFGNDPRIPVILMTIGTGAVGLTITAANKVHLVEPQWNPFVEEQAIARAVRMGQKREVTIVRYVVKGSVEKNIMDLQRRKSNLAKFTIDQADKMSGNLEDLRFVLDI